ncbi:MAG TPA: histidine phosphatase family protein [Mycobacteriales bacterium]
MDTFGEQQQHQYPVPGSGDPGPDSGDTGGPGAENPGGFDYSGGSMPTVGTTVCLVRHGETDWNVAGRLQGREDIPLNARGREQARLSGQALCATGWDLILTSPLIRAAETARIIAEIAAVPRVVEVPDLVERDYGMASGLTRAEKHARFFDGVVPGEEDRASARDRSLAVLVSWVDRHRDGRILVVTHGGVISALLTAVSRGAVVVAPGSLANACLNVLHHVDGGWRVLAHNVVDHLVAGRSLPGRAVPDRLRGGRAAR